MRLKTLQYQAHNHYWNQGKEHQQVGNVVVVEKLFLYPHSNQIIRHGVALVIIGLQGFAIAIGIDEDFDDGGQFEGITPSEGEQEEESLVGLDQFQSYPLLHKNTSNEDQNGPYDHNVS